MQTKVRKLEKEIAEVTGNKKRLRGRKFAK